MARACTLTLTVTDRDDDKCKLILGALAAAEAAADGASQNVAPDWLLIRDLCRLAIEVFYDDESVFDRLLDALRPKATVVP